MGTQQVYIQTRENVSSGDINAVGGLALQVSKDFNKAVFQQVDSIVNGLQIVAPGSPTTGSVTIKSGNAFYNSPNTTTSVPFANPAISLSLKGSVINIPSDEAQPITTPHATLDRIDAIDIRYTENQDTPASRAFVQTDGSIVTSTVNTKTTSNVPLTGVAGSVITYTQGTPGVSPTPPAVPSGYIRLSTIYVHAGLVYNITQPDITESLPRIWEQQNFPNNAANPLVTPGPNQPDQSVSLADSLSALRYQLNAIIGLTNWYNAPETNLHEIAFGQSGFIKNGASIRMFDIDQKALIPPSDWTSGLSAKGIVVGRGVIGFPDGTIRRNSSEKYLDFANSYAPGFSGLSTSSQPIGFVDTFPTSQPSTSFLKASTRYAVFAIADHTGSDFNIVASEIPFVSSGVTLSLTANNTVTAGGTFTNASGDVVFHPDRTLVRMALAKQAITQFSGTNTLDLGNPSSFATPGRFTGSGNSSARIGQAFPNGDTGVLDEPQLTSASSSTLVTKGFGLTAPLSGGGSNGSVFVIGGYKPENFSRFRYLGSFLTDTDGLVYPFKVEGAKNIFVDPFIFLSKTYTFQASDVSTHTMTLDTAGIVPGTAQSLKLSVLWSNALSNGSGLDVQGNIKRTVFTSGSPQSILRLLLDGVNGMGALDEQRDLPIYQSTLNMNFKKNNVVLGDYPTTLSLVLNSFDEDIYDEWRRQ